MHLIDTYQPVISCLPSSLPFLEMYVLYRDMLYRGFLLCDDIICFTYRPTAYTELFCEDTWQLETEVTKYS